MSALNQSNPFPGLRPFEEAEAGLFFGREEEITTLLGRIIRQHFLAVLGSSGCGKSSLIKAGLIPSLKYELLDDGEPAWRIAVMRPGNAPFKQLAIALAQQDALGKFQQQTEAAVPLMYMTLRRGPLGIVEATGEAGLPPEANLLILVDQFEELFRFADRSDKANAIDEARAFINLLLAAANQRDVPIYIVLTMRSEFLGQCAAFRGLAEAITGGLYLLPNMTRDQLREVIQKPIVRHHGEITERLCNRLLNDLGGNTDQLPILQHALMRLWTYWEPQHADGAMDLEHYEFVGELSGSLSAHAEAIYQEDLQTEREKYLAETLFRSITETTPEGQTVRKPTKLKVICQRAASDHDDLSAVESEMKAVIEQFRKEGRSFLMPPQRVELDAETTIDISHESLIRQWKRLSDWAEVEAKEIKLYADLKRDAATWVEKKQNPDWLYTGARLSEAQEWAAAHANLLDDTLAKNYLSTSIELQKYATLLARCKRWHREGREESLLLRGKELDEAEGWLRQAETSKDLRPILLAKEVKEMVTASRNARNQGFRQKVALAVAILLILSVAVYGYVQQSRAARAAEIALSKVHEAEQAKDEAEKQKDRAEQQKYLAEIRSKELQNLENVLVDNPDYKRQQANNAGLETAKLRELIHDPQSITVRYFVKPGDEKNVTTTLEAIGYHVDAQPGRANNPTNAIWWGDGISLEDVKLIAYTLIRNGYVIRYIGKSDTFTKQIQIGGQVAARLGSAWSVEEVNTLTALPVDNEGQ